MSQSDASLAAVEDWKRKCFESSNHSTDVLLSPLLKAFDITTLILSESGDRNDIQRALLTLNAERKISMRFEKVKCDPMRMLFHGLMQSFHLALVKLTNKINRLENSIERRPLTVDGELNRHYEISMSPAPSILLVKKEQITERPVSNDNQDSGTNGAESVVKMEPLDVVDESPPCLIREEILPESFNEQSNGVVEDNEVDNRSSIVDGPPAEETSQTFHRKEEGNGCDVSMYYREEPSSNAADTATQALRRSSRPQKRILPLGQDSEEEVPGRLVKRKRLLRRSAKLSASTPDRSKLIMERSLREEVDSLLCESGQEYTPSKHVPEISLDDLTKLSQNNKTRCILCDKFPGTPQAYAQHLYLYHKSTLKEIGIYLVCSCGDEKTSISHNPIHNKRCDGLRFTVHKRENLYEKTTNPSSEMRRVED